MANPIKTLKDAYPKTKLKDSSADIFKDSDYEKTATLTDAPGIADVRRYVGQIAEKKIDELLNIPLGETLLGAFLKLKDLTQFAQGEKRSSGKVYDYNIFNHVITSTHKPSIALCVHGQIITTIDFKITLKFHIAEATLKICKGKVQGITVKSMKIKGSISAYNHKLAELEEKEFEHSIDISLGNGVEIPTLMTA